MTDAATVWTGPTIAYTQPGTDPTLPANQDRLTPNVWLTRGATMGLFNAKTETFFTHFLSPTNTEWANGTTANFASLSYTDWNTWAKTVHGGAQFTVGINAVVHLKSEDIYLDIKFTAWPQGGTFAYLRSTPATSLPSPTVTITNPVNNAVFAAPANVTIGATATVSSGSVTNVEFFGNSTSLGSVQASPFNLTTGNLAAGNYALTAVATATGVSAGSPVVNITVVSPIAISVTAPIITNGQFSFDYTASPGLTYVVENSLNLVNWLPVATNIAAGNPVHFADSFIPGGSHYYRVGRMPNP